MINCPVSEHGKLCILVVDFILRISLVLFSLLRAINYEKNKGALKVDLFKRKIIHSRLLRIAVLQSISLQWVIKFVFIYNIVRYTCEITFVDIVHWYLTILLFLLCSILNCHGTLIFSQISNLFFCGIFKHNVFAAVREFHKLSLVNNNNCRNQSLVTQTKQPKK